MSPRGRRGTRRRRASARARRGARLGPSASMRVCVGSPGTFSTRKWRSARLAICGRWVIVITWARAASRRSVSPTAWAVWPPMPASISSKTIVSPPATAAIASAIRESSPPEAVSATGPNGSPAFGRTENRASSAPDGPGSAVSRARPGTRPRRGRRRRARPRPPRRSAGAASRRALAERGVEAVDLRLRWPRRAAAAARAGSWPVGERVELRPRVGGAREQLVVARCAVAAAQVGDPVERGLDLLEPARLGLERVRGTARGRCPISRSAELGGRAAPRPAAASSGASRLERARRARSAARDEVGAALAARRSEIAASGGPRRPRRARSTWRSRSRSARSSSSLAGLEARRCPRRARAARRAAPRRRRRRVSARRGRGAPRRARARRGGPRAPSRPLPAKASSTASW